MRRNKFFVRTIATLVILAFAVTASGTDASSQPETVLHSFGNGRDGAQPSSNLVFDAAGNFYGETNAGGAFGFGTIYELSPSARGWTEKVLYNFSNVGNDGYLPSGGLVLDALGNLFGTTTDGGIYCCGTTFELIKSGDQWTEKILHNFGNGSDGSCSCSNLIFDAVGNLYGTASAGGGNSAGIAFELTPTAAGRWKERILYSFHGLSGNQPYAGLTFDAAGNLYGTTLLGGNCGTDCGAVFRLTPDADGGWTETVIHDFNTFQDSGDGANPYAGIVIDPAGNLYGTTSNGGLMSQCNGLGCGVVYELSPGPDGSWTETILHRFGNGDEGFNVVDGLTFNAAGDLYGTTPSGLGTGFGCGTIFKLSPKHNGGWSERLFFAFNSGGACGPGGLTIDSVGNLYGTAGGGAYNNCAGGGSCGTAFEITP